MADGAVRHRIAAGVGWGAALVAVPSLLAGIALIWPGAAVGDDIGERSRAALAGAGLSSVDVAVSGRDVVLDAVPRGSEGAALAAVEVLDGVRVARVGSVAEPPQPAPQPPPQAPPDVRSEVVAVVRSLTVAAPITFDADTAELREPVSATVARVAAVLAGSPSLPVELIGFCADSPGPPQVAQELSERRAVAVADALVAAGIDRSRVTTVGRGAADPLSTREASRRVEIRIP